ncbi:MAG: PQQ-like beta-propeller repeat protein [Holophagales bacterium]|nr:PQQ-like beta-propeller repeat protein [Holophagales bacterium]
MIESRTKPNSSAEESSPAGERAAEEAGSAGQKQALRLLPGWIGRIVLALPLVAMLVVRLTQPGGDRGMANGFSMMLAGVFVLLWLFWLLVASGNTWRSKAAVLGSLVAAVALFALFFRFDRMTGEMVPVFVPRLVATAEPATEAPEPTVSEGIDLTTETADDFPQFLGPGRRQAVDHIRLDPDWKSHPPEELWRRSMGAGLGAFAVRNGYAVTLEQRGDREMVTCYRVADGEPCWSWSHEAHYGSVVAGDGPRTTPTIYDGMVYALGTYGTLVALDGTTGELVWRRELEEEVGSRLTQERLMEVLPYGRSNSPLVHPELGGGELLVVAGGGTAETGFASLLAFDRRTGELVWRAGDRQISCSSPAFAEIAGRPQVLSVDEDRVAGYDPIDGTLLWSHPWEGRTEANASVSQPVALPPSRVFVSKGYGVGAALLELGPAAGGAAETALAVQELWHNPRSLRTKFTNVVIYEGHVYGLSDGILECLELETGKRKWKKGRYRQGQILRVGSHLLVLAESGDLFLVELDPERPNAVLGRLQVLEGKTWNNLALHGDVLLLRNGVEAAAYRLKLAG